MASATTLNSTPPDESLPVSFLVTRAVGHYLRQLGPADPLAVRSRDERQGVLT